MGIVALSMGTSGENLRGSKDNYYTTYYYSSDEETSNLPAVPEVAHSDSNEKLGTISSDEENYECDEEVAFTVSVNSKNSKTSDYSGWTVGIFMREANPQGGALLPIISLPLCPDPGCVLDSEGSVKTPVVFGMSTLNMTQWPMDLYMYGTGFDAYVLDEQGSDVLGPARFNIHMPL